MQSTRSPSFEHDDERRFQHGYHGQQQQYHDSMMHHPTSPPPQYTTPAPPEPQSPVSLSHAQPYATHHPRSSADIHRDPSPQRYIDASSPPPPPPPHRMSPSKHLQGDSINRPVGAMPHMTEDGHLRSQVPQDRMYTPGGYDRRGPQPEYTQHDHYQDSSSPTPSPYLQRPGSRLHEHSYGSNAPLAGGAATPGSITPTAASDMRSSHYSLRSIPLDEYYSSHPYRMSLYSHNDSPYHNSSHINNATVSGASINPNNIADDGEDDFMPGQRNQSSYAMHQTHNVDKSGATAAASAAPATGVLGGMFSRKPKAQVASGTYQPVNNAAEKSEWLAYENKKRKRNGWLCGIVIVAVIIVAIVAGIVGGVVSRHSYQSGGGGSINNAGDDTAANGDLDINSAEIKKLMNNPNLHKVFPGMDYTPWGVQYPLCETYPPSQNNVTRDVAVLSQLTNTIRLYGTDCNQTEMVLHAIERLKLKNIKVWLGVWVDANQTTTDRQVAQMYKILDQVKDRSIFKGAIIGNEALYRAGLAKASSKQQLIQILKEVKSNFTTLNYNLPVATSDLGDNWDGDLVSVVDYVMSNIHPFFAGVSAEKAAAWTWDFWQDHDVRLTTSLPNVKQIISETGWPSDGGTDCGGADGTCAAGQSGATASVANMNTFMNTWVCQAMANGTDYFWFEAFDEPWKIQYNTAGKEWEDKWGLLDSARNLKPGVKIPNCGGKTVS